MANEQHLDILNEGVTVWNRWRDQNPTIRPDLRRAELSNRNLSGANLSNADLDYAQLNSVNLTRANLNEADMYEANLAPAPFKYDEKYNLIPTDLTDATLIGARLHNAALVYTQLVRADLTDAQLWGIDAFAASFSEATLVRTEISEAKLYRAQFPKANLTGAYLTESSLVKTSFEGATLTGCNVYGISAWDVNLTGATQSGLIITETGADENGLTVTVDDLEVAQFVYLLISNEKLRRVIDTITSKVVLILGRFTEERKAILDALREELRSRNYVPVQFDFQEPASRDVDETVSLLAHLARFIVADLTEPRSIPHELRGIVPELSVPIQPLLVEGKEDEYGMYASFAKYHWVLDTYRYADETELLANLEEKIIGPAEAKVEELRSRK